MNAALQSRDTASASASGIAEWVVTEYSSSSQRAERMRMITRPPSVVQAAATR
ncbi:hypothetical protein B7C42_07825 [Nocardia cerradoensis]|uniref:Uncharacterized protein n=1 Tax=Nocardia cerradoensis TaxID=85688 RepID=A0A231GU17_9NOCA|nr:hypothetical protein B7C42_07825 [Nocardia cerradoensis]